MNYFENKNSKKNLIIFIIIITLIFTFVFLIPFIKLTLDKKFMLYRSSHDKVDFNITTKEQFYPLKGSLILNYSSSNNYIKIKSSSNHSTVHPIDIGVICEKGHDDKFGNYIKIRHVLQDKKVFYSLYGNLPSIPDFSQIDWLNRNTVLYSGYDLDFLYFQLLDENNNPVDPTNYIKLN